MKHRVGISRMLIVIMLCALFLIGCKEDVDTVYKTNEDLDGKKIGVAVGTNEDIILQKKYKNPKLEYYNSNADLKAALEYGKIESLIIDKPIGEYICSIEGGFRLIEPPVHRSEYGVMFKKNDKKSTQICKQMNKFIKKIKNTGFFDKLHDKWYCKENDKQDIDYEALKNKNGVIKLATSSACGQPFAYFKNNKFIGYNIDFAYEFCKEYGYALKVYDYEFGAIFSGALNKCDFCIACIEITEERKENLLFSEPYCDAGYVNLVRDIEKKEDNSFFKTIKTGIENTLIRESRWKLFVNGVLCTIRIVFLSIILGTILGAVFYALYRKKVKIVNDVFDILIYLVQGMPVVVFLMIFFYVVFASNDISGEVVSIISFSIIFGMDVLELMIVSVDTVDKIQEEAAIALGYTKRRAFYRIILSQSMKFFLPVYKVRIKTIVKETSIVGYIAVQDLTKIGDIIRSRTYQPFFSLLLIAIIYYVITAVSNIIINIIQRKIDVKNRKKCNILKNIRIKDNMLYQK